MQAGADVNLPNNFGDTPLHKAAFTGRKVSLSFYSDPLVCFFGVTYTHVSFNHMLFRKLSCCCCTMMHVLLSSMGQLRFPKMSLKTQRSEAC